MAKLSLHPNDITCLLKTNPEIEIEILDKVHKNVAELLYKKITREETERRIDMLVTEILSDRIGVNDRKITEPYSAMIHNLVKKFMQEQLAAQLSPELRQMIRDEVALLVPKALAPIVKQVRDEIRQHLKDEIVQLLLTK